MDSLWRYKFRRTTLISLGLGAFLIGLIAVKVMGWSLAASHMPFALVPLLYVFRRRKILALIGVMVVGAMLGLWRGGEMSMDVARYGKYRSQTVTLTGSIRDDPVYDDNGQLDFRVGNVTVNGEPLPGQVRVKGRVNDVRRGDTVKVQGSLRPGYGNYQASMSFATVIVTERSGSWVEKVRREFFASVYSIMPDPQASLGLGFLVGLRSALPEEFDEQLRVAGLTHIVVASGYNLTVLVRLSRRMLAKRSKYQAMISSAGLVLGFIAITGASPSITRAAVVTLLSLAAWYYGRRIHPVAIILLGAAITAGISPLYIWYDLGWWLSFLAFTGVLILAPLLSRRLFKGKQPPLPLQVATETIAAQVMATPLIILIFGEFSMVALLANIVVVPLIPFAMLFTFAGGLAGIVSPVLGSWLAVPAQLILGYIVAVTQLLAAPSWAQQHVVLGQSGLVVLYSLVLVGGAILYHKTRLRFRDVPPLVE